MTTVAGTRRRVRVRVDGTVQGVGFRPYVFRLASELGLGGWVLNDARGVGCEVEGDAAAVDAFLGRLPAGAPPLARIERIESGEVRVLGETEFSIRESPAARRPDAPISPDVATCDACLRELWDPADRRHRYPFINCTDCGPRFTIVRGVPYDRPFTTMRGFEMCARCRAEYEDPHDRRFHAQPNACPACGPSLRLVDPSGHTVADREDALGAVANALRAGRIVAVKGLGGFHLACAATDEDAVAALRARKHREAKPFALMVAGLDEARSHVELDAEAERLLASPARPIVLAPRRRNAKIAAAVAPRHRELGVMLPYSPLHHILLADARRTLVMTSGNVSDEPIAYTDDDALARLGGIADLLLLHDRPIETRTDDSVVRATAGRRLTLRRSRGHVPDSLALPVPARRDVLACGAELKSTFCLARGARAWVGHHIGDLRNWETLRSFRAGIDHFELLFAVAPAVVAHDLHPDYLSTRYALAREGTEPVAVQHHHAHLAACLAEHGDHGPAVGAIYDGAGLGPDGSVWGGELLVGDLTGFARAGHLQPVRLPGGDAAAREPWRMACAWLCAALAAEEPPAPRALASETRWAAIARLAHSELAPVTTSMGRLFDAVAALCGVRACVSYEGQAAVELEAAAAGRAARGAYDMPLVEDGDALVLDAAATVRQVHADVERGVDAGVVAARFHAAVARTTVEACARIADARGLGTVVLSGGVFQNRRLLDATVDGLARRGLRVLVPERLPPNDGGVAYGQAAVASALEARC